MTCVSSEGRYARHLFVIREHGEVKLRSPVCLRCGVPRKPPPPDRGRCRPEREKRVK